MIATVAPGWRRVVQFQRLSLEDIRAVNASANYPEPLVRWCYENNHQ